MSKVLSYLVFSVVIAQYVIASLGISVHKCNSAGTVDVTILYTDSACEQVHDHCKCGSSHCHSQKHDDHCCTTEVHSIDKDYDASYVQSISKPVMELIAVLHTLSERESFLLENSNQHNPFIGVKRPPDLCSRQVLNLISQFRL